MVMRQLRHVLIYLSTPFLLVSQTCAQWQTFNPPKTEGEACGKLDGQEWTCQTEKNCSDLSTLTEKGWVITCSTKRSERIVCCPPRPDQPAKLVLKKASSVSEQKCREYHAATEYCSSWLKPFSEGNRKKRDTSNSSGSTQPQAGERKNSSKLPDFKAIYDELELQNNTKSVLFGVKASPGEIPHAALVGYGIKRSWLCGGTLVSERFVLSAAHCAYPDNLGPAKWVRLGDLDYDTDTDNTRPQDFFIVQRFVHPDYNQRFFYNDIALFRLDHPAVFNTFVAPACVYHQSDYPPEDHAGSVIAAGWGKTERQKRTTRLQKVILNVIETEKCKTSLDNSTGVLQRFLPFGVNGTTMICAWEKGKDTCQGDSGGPLIMTWSRHCLGHLVGVTSFGPGGCEPSDAPGVYTRVSAFLPWLEHIVWPNFTL